MKKTVYLDSSIPSFLFDDRPEMITLINITHSWWQNEKMKYDLWLSIETLAELNSGNYPKKKEVLDSIKDINVLNETNIIVDIVEVYIKNFVMPLKASGDAVHLAYASYYEMDYLLTWNCNHLANANKTKHIHTVNDSLGLTTPMIITPLELTEEEDDV